MLIFAIILISLSIFGFGVAFVRIYDEIQREKHEQRFKYLKKTGELNG